MAGAEVPCSGVYRRAVSSWVECADQKVGTPRRGVRAAGRVKLYVAAGGGPLGERSHRHQLKPLGLPPPIGVPLAACPPVHQRPAWQAGIGWAAEIGRASWRERG